MKSKYASIKKRAEERGIFFNLSYEYFRELKLSDCYYCGTPEIFLQFYCQVMGINTPWMTIDRKDNGGGYTPENVVPACFLCNKIKGSFFTDTEMKQIGDLFVRPKMKKFEKEAFEEYGEWCHQFPLDDDDYPY